MKTKLYNKLIANHPDFAQADPKDAEAILNDFLEEVYDMLYPQLDKYEDKIVATIFATIWGLEVSAVVTYYSGDYFNKNEVFRVSCLVGLPELDMSVELKNYVAEKWLGR